MKRFCVLIMVLVGCLGFLTAQTYRVGDLYTAPDGSQGIVYYLLPNGTGGWVVALDNVSGEYTWGDLSDIASLSNQNNSNYQVLLQDTAGYANTQAIRNEQNNNTYAAGAVNFANGWYLPSPAQLRILFARMPFIANALTNAGGSLLSLNWYWTSAEKNATEAWAVDFGFSVYHGHFLPISKDFTAKIRAVRSFTYEPTYAWSTGDTTDSITVAPNQTTTYTVTVTSPFGCSEEASKTIALRNVFPQTFYDTICQGMAYDTNGFTLTSAETNVVGMLTRTHEVESEGCFVTDTLQLWVNAIQSSSVPQTACDSYTWNGVTYSESGSYTQTFTAANGCDSVVTLELTLYNDTDNPTVLDYTACDSVTVNGITFTSDTVLYDTLSNVHGCDSVVVTNVTIIQTPTVYISGSQFFCPDSSVTLYAITDGTPQSYLWSTGETGDSIVVSEPGVYTVTASFAGGCSAESPDFHAFETENPIANAHLSDMVAGDTQTVVIGTVAGNNLQYLTPQSTLTYSEITFLPDGVPCNGSCSYKANLSFSGFPDTAAIQSANDIHYIRLNMEHSYIPDLYINLTCPNGQRSDILKKYTGNSTSPCLDSIASSHIGWNNAGANVPPYNVYPNRKTYFGRAYRKYDNSQPCDSTRADNAPGTGWNYCWSNNADQGYNYAPGEGSLVYRLSNVHVETINFTAANVVDSSNVLAGSRFYHPDVSFDSLVGCPINGTWTIEVIDGITNDNGYIFEAELSVAEHLSGTHYGPVSYMQFDSLWVTRTGDSTFIITPPEDLANDTVVGYTFTLLDENGCTFDTTIYIHIYAHKHIDLYDTVYADELPHEWENVTFYHAGCRDTLLYTVHGADSVITLHLSVIYPYDTTICENETPLLWHNHSFSISDSIVVPYSLDCADSIEVLVVSVNPVFSDTTVQVLCDSAIPFAWRGHEYSTTGVYYDALTSSLGCDSVYVLMLTVHNSTSSEIHASALENNLPYVLNNIPYDSTGVYVQHQGNSNGCDSTITLYLTVLDNVQTVLDSAVCDSLLPIVWNGLTFTEAGSQDTTYVAANGADSTVMMILTVLHSTSEMIVTNVVENALPYSINGVEYDTSGIYVQHLTNADGCDSVLTIQLVVAYNTVTYKQATICDNMLPAQWEGHVWLGAGVIVDTFLAVTGADSVVVKTLTVGLSSEREIYDTILQNNLPYILNDSSYYAPGDYIQHRTNNAGCDSAITLHLTVLYNVHTELDSTVCDSLLPIVWDGVTFNQAGTDSIVYTAANGVDSVVLMTLVVNPSSDSTLMVSVIENSLPFQINGFEYTDSGTYTQSLDNALGCDSTLTIELTVLYNVRVEVDSAVCDGYFPIMWNGVEFTGPGTDSTTLTASTGVDSTVVMTVEVHYPSQGTFAAAVVENDLPYQLNGYSYDTAGTYTQHLTNVAGCDSTLTVQLTVYYNVTTEVDSIVCPSSLPFTWNGEVFTDAGTLTAVLLAANGADSIVVMTVSLWDSPEANISGPEVLCADSYTTLVADSALAYLWSTGEATQSINVSASGYYSVTVTGNHGCTNADTFHVGNVVTVDPLADINLQDLCAGNSYTFTVGYEEDDNFVISDNEASLSMTDTIFLPDGVDCSPYGCSYQSPLTFTDFADDATVTSVNDIRYVRLNLEHSYAGDLYVNITCPNGQKADILKLEGNSNPYFNSDCLSNIPQSSRQWQNGNNASNSTYFGMANDDENSVQPCNANHPYNAPGTGWNYCWSNNTDQGYTYAPGAGSLVYRSVNVHEHPNAYAGWFFDDDVVTIFDSSNVAAGTQFYHPDESFASLIGCPLNGSWYIEVMDGFSQDNGYLFGWELALASTFASLENTEVTSTSVEGPWVAQTNDLTFVITPPADLAHDTVVPYTVHFYDDYGCGYDTVVFLNVYAQSHTVMDTVVCGSFVWGGTTYTQTQEITWNGMNAHGCDSTLHINLTVNPIPVTSITGLPEPCVDTTATLSAVCADTTVAFLWNTGDTLSTITVTTPGEYSITTTSSEGCSYDTAVSISFPMPSQFTIDTTVCDHFLWNGTTYTQTGVVVNTFTNSVGCDSVVTVNLTVNNSYTAHDTLHLLQNQLPYYFAPSDTTFAYGSSSSFQFSYTLPAQNGCDSVIMEQVYVYMNSSQTFDTTVCADALPLQWHGHTFTATSSFTDSLHTVFGSDSVLIYNVTVDVISATIGNVTHINCYGENTGAATATVSGGVAPLVYQWTNGAGVSVSTTVQITNKPAGSYTFTVTDAVGCSATETVTLNTLHGQMQAGTISGPQELCFGDTLGVVSGTAATGDDCVYQWQISTDGTNWTPMATPNNTQNYSMLTPSTSAFQIRRAWISDDCGTLYSNTMIVNVWPISSDTIYDDVCMGQPYQQHGFEISEAETVGLGLLTSVKYYTNVHGCDSTMTLLLTIHEPQDTTITAVICEGRPYYENGFSILSSETIGEDSLLRILSLQTVDGCDSIVHLEASVVDTALRIENLTEDFCEDMFAELQVLTNMPDYEWNTGDQTQTITVTAPGAYSITATQGGCTVTGRYVIEPCVFQLYLPNAITPGRGDGLNDYFSLPALAQDAINLFEISIFNRWGELVFYSTDKHFMWNGEYKGTIYHQTVYNYVIEYTDSAGRPFRVTGSLTVL